MIRVTKYGYREFLLATLLTGAIGLGLIYLGASGSKWLGVLAVIPLALWCFVLWFFRDPYRELPLSACLVCPADGHVADITPLGSESLLGCEGVQIGIFMNVFDVHVNRAPCTGTIESIAHMPGTFLDARDPAAKEKNESATIIMTHSRNSKDYRLVIRQIAGLVARRIVTDLAAGQQVQAGQRFGMIKFGSRVELLATNELIKDVKVTIGQKVTAGETILMAMRND